VNHPVWLCSGDIISFWAVKGLFDIEFYYYFFFWISAITLSVYYCFPRSIVSGDSSSVQNFFFFHNRNIICYTHTTTEIYDSSSCLLTRHKLHTYYMFYLLLLTAVVQKNRTLYFGVQQNDNFNDFVLRFMCILYKLINSTCTAIDCNIIMCIWLNVFFQFSVKIVLWFLRNALR